MPIFDNLMETVLALAGLGLVLNVAFAVVVWIYVLVFIGGPLTAVVLGLVFIVIGALIVVGYVQSYAS